MAPEFGDSRTWGKHHIEPPRRQIRPPKWDTGVGEGVGKLRHFSNNSRTEQYFKMRLSHESVYSFFSPYCDGKLCSFPFYVPGRGKWRLISQWLKKPWINHLTYNDFSRVANLLTLFIILTSSNECMAYLTSVLFTVVSIVVTNPLLCYRIWHHSSFAFIHHGIWSLTPRSDAIICRLDKVKNK